MAKREEPKYRSARERADNRANGYEGKTIIIPEGVKLFKLKSAGTINIDILPYTVGKGNPQAEEGELYFERTFHTHRNIGVGEDSYVCPAKTVDERCPICEYRSKLTRDPKADEDLIKALKPTERQLFLVIDHANREAGVQLWDISYHLFGKALDAALKDDDEKQFSLFYHATEGYSLRGVVEEKTMGRGKPFYSVERVTFKERKVEIDDEVLAKAGEICLDELLVIKPYAELKAIFLQTGDEEVDPKKDVGKQRAAADDDLDMSPPKKRPAAAADDDDAPPPKKRPAATVDDDDAPPPKKRPAAPADDDDAPPPKKRPAAEVDDDDAPPPKKRPAQPADDDDAPPPKKRPAQPADDDDAPPPKKRPAPPADDDDDAPPPKKRPVASDDDDDAPPPPKKRPAAAADDDDAPPPKKKPAPAADNWDDEAPPPKKRRPAEDAD